MQVRNVCAARTFVQVIDVLRDDVYELGRIVSHEVGDGNVPRVGCGLHDFHAPPFVPAPHQRWVGAVALW